MDDTLGRLVVVAGIGGVAVLAGYLATRLRRPTHPPVRLRDLGLPAGVVVFTSSQCDNCKRVMSAMRGVASPVREVTHELEPALFDAAGVEAVPLVVITDRRGHVVRQLAGKVSRSAIRRAVDRAGW